MEKNNTPFATIHEIKNILPKPGWQKPMLFSPNLVWNSFQRGWSRRLFIAEYYLPSDSSLHKLRWKELNNVCSYFAGGTGFKASWTNVLLHKWAARVCNCFLKKRYSVFASRVNVCISCLLQKVRLHRILSLSLFGSARKIHSGVRLQTTHI